jgi:predicted  nucleic acid-binding Zn-ribbon protein
MLGNAENMQHFRGIASGNATLLNTLNNLPQDPQQLNAVVAQLSDLEYARLKSLSGVDFHQHFEEAFNAGGATSMKQAVAQLKDTFKGYGEKFTEQVTKLQETLQKISPRSSAALDSDRVVVASAGGFDGLLTQLPTTPSPSNALQQTFSFLQDKAHESLEAMGSAAKATVEFVHNHAAELTAASAAVTLVRAHIDVTQKGLDEKATFKERAVAALTTKVSVQEYAGTLSQSRYALGLARTVALAAVAITPAAMSVAATIGAIQMTQTVAGGAAAFTKHQLSKTEQRLSALQAEEGAGRAAEQIAKLTERQERLQNRAAAFETVANASLEDVSNVAKGAAQNISNAKDSMFKQALKVTESAQQLPQKVQGFFGNLAKRFGNTAEVA